MYLNSHFHLKNVQHTNNAIRSATIDRDRSGLIEQKSDGDYSNQEADRADAV